MGHTIVTNQRPAPIFTVFHWLLGLLCVLLLGCQADIRRPNEQNPYYQQGMALLKSSRYEEAARAFERCLQYSPESYQAHLQLAILCEDNLRDLPRAIVHYRAYLEQAPDEDAREKARLLLERAEETYYFDLREKFEAPPARPPPAALEPPSIKGLAEPPPPPSQIDTRPAESPPPAPEPTPLKTYTVQAGDNLTRIARKVYGPDGSQRWRDIYQANRHVLDSPDDLQVGQVLTIPR